MASEAQTKAGGVAEVAQLATGFNRDDSFQSSEASLLSQFMWTMHGNEFVPAYYSKNRDRKLRQFWHRPGAGHLASAMYSAQSKLASIPFNIVARDMSTASHVNEAAATEQRLRNFSEFGAGLDVTMAKFYEDLLSTDNGGFIEIIGKGNPAGPIEGQPVALRHLDSVRCTRTGDPVFPILYTGKDGRQRKMHFSRVIAVSQMPSPRRELNGVGYCAVSRALDFGQALLDITLFKREKLGSRPTDGILLGKGIRGEDIMKTMRAAATHVESTGARAGYWVALGSDSTDVDMDLIQLKSMEGIDEQSATAMSMAAIALAFGLEPADLWPQNDASTRAGEIVSLMRSRGKLPIQVMRAVEREFEFKVLPPYLRVEFSYIDDEEDKNRAAVADIRARMRHRNMDAGITNIQFERRRMLAANDMTREEFVEAELRDGRLEDGTPVVSLFFSGDPFFTGPNGLVNIGFENPLLVPANDPAVIIPAILLCKQKIFGYLQQVTSPRDRRKGLEALSAMKQLLHVYDPTFDPKSDLRPPSFQPEQPNNAPEGNTRVDGRTDREGFRDNANGGTV